MAWRSLGMPGLDEYRWLRELRAASHSFSTARSGEGMSGLPEPKSMMSSPACRAVIFKSLMIERAYGGSPLLRRKSISMGTTQTRLHPHRLKQGPGQARNRFDDRTGIAVRRVGTVRRADDGPRGARGSQTVEQAGRVVGVVRERATPRHGEAVAFDEPRHLLGRDTPQVEGVGLLPPDLLRGG